MTISSWYQITLKARKSLVSIDVYLVKTQFNTSGGSDCIPHMTSLTLVVMLKATSFPQFPAMCIHENTNPVGVAIWKRTFWWKAVNIYLDTIFFGRNSCNIHYDWDRAAIQPTNEFIKGKTQPMLSHESNTTMTQEY